MRTETLLGTYIPQMLAANIQYKYILSGKHFTLVIHKLCLANCQL